MKIWLWLGCLLVTSAYAEQQTKPQLQYHLGYTYYEAEGIDNEGCYTFMMLKTQIGNNPPKVRKLCSAGDVAVKINEHDRILFIEYVGGNAAGWGLYRYNVEKDILDEYHFNAREIHMVQKDEKGVWLNVYFAVHDLRPGHGGYLPDRLEKWYWPFDSKVPTRRMK